MSKLLFQTHNSNYEVANEPRATQASSEHGPKRDVKLVQAPKESRHTRRKVLKGLIAAAVTLGVTRPIVGAREAKTKTPDRIGALDANMENNVEQSVTDQLKRLGEADTSGQERLITQELLAGLEAGFKISKQVLEHIHAGLSRMQKVGATGIGLGGVIGTGIGMGGFEGNEPLTSKEKLDVVVVAPAMATAIGALGAAAGKFLDEFESTGKGTNRKSIYGIFQTMKEAAEREAHYLAQKQSEKYQVDIRRDLIEELEEALSGKTIPAMVNASPIARASAGRFINMCGDMVGYQFRDTVDSPEFWNSVQL